jgi:hypothetical protein
MEFRRYGVLQALHVIRLDPGVHEAEIESPVAELKIPAIDDHIDRGLIKIHSNSTEPAIEQLKTRFRLEAS